jgi:metal-sulfur cluster biosynthetic enzyme
MEHSPDRIDSATPDEPEVDSAAGQQHEDSGVPLTADRVKLALRKVKDPELNLNIIDLGLVYDIVVFESKVEIDMSLTSPGCPAGPQIMTDVERAAKAIPGVGSVAVNLVWTPMWTPERIEPRVRAYMGL